MVAVEAKNTQQDTDIAGKADAANLAAIMTSLPPAPHTPADDGKVLTAVTGHPRWQAPFWTGTQAEYTALATKDPHTLYVVTG
jgi:hypothetical protein